MEIDRQKIAAILGNEALVDRFIKTFFEESFTLLEGMAKALSDSDAPELARCAHSLKSHCRYVGLENMAEVAAWIESEAQGATEQKDLGDAIERLKVQLSELDTTSR